MCLAAVNETRRSFNDKSPKTFLCKSLKRNNCYRNIVYTEAHSSGRFCSENITHKYLSLKTDLVSRDGRVHCISKYRTVCGKTVAAGL